MLFISSFIYYFSARGSRRRFSSNAPKKISSSVLNSLKQDNNENNDESNDDSNGDINGSADTVDNNGSSKISNGSKSGDKKTNEVKNFNSLKTLEFLLMLTSKHVIKIQSVCRMYRWVLFFRVYDRCICFVVYLYACLYVGFMYAYVRIYCIFIFPIYILHTYTTEIYIKNKIFKYVTHILQILQTLTYILHIHMQQYI